MAWGAVAGSFAFTLVPISIGYQVAHYSPFLLLQGQALIPLSSDPFGFGWDLWGTRAYQLNIGLATAKAAWFIGVGAIVLGHILAVFLAHLLALRLAGEPARALRSQYPLVALMVFYTVLSLWIISQPIVR